MKTFNFSLFNKYFLKRFEQNKFNNLQYLRWWEASYASKRLFLRAEHSKPIKVKIKVTIFILLHSSLRRAKIFIYPKFCIEQPNQIFALSALFARPTLQILAKFYTQIFYFELVFQSQSCDNDSLLFSPQKCIGSIAHFFPQIESLNQCLELENVCT